MWSPFATSAIEANCVQELVVFVAPKLLGGKSAMSPLNSFGFESINSTYKLQHSFLDRKGKIFVGDYFLGH